MKQSFFTLVIFLFAAVQIFTQTPQFINFQAVARDNSGNPKPNQSVSVFFNIKNASNTSIYQEIQSATTDACGMFNLKIGNGNGAPIAFNQIDWSTGAKTLEVKIDGVLIGNQEMVSVPYALYAEKTKITAGNGISVSGNTVTNAAPDQPVSIAGSGGTSVTGTYPNFTINSNTPPTLTAGNGVSISGNTVTNTAPDQPVSITGSGATTVTGTYPNFTINSTNPPAIVAGSGISISGNTISNTGDLSNTNEIQTLSIAGNQLSISNSNMVTLPSAPNFTAGAGISISGNTITNTAPSNIITVNTSNMNSITPNDGNVIVIDGNLSLSSAYTKLSKDYTSIVGGSVSGNGQSITFGNFAVVTGVKFNNVAIKGTKVSFVGCSFTSTTEMPFEADLSNCRLNTCTLSSQLGQLDNCTVIGGTIDYVKRITNSLISGTILGGNGNNYFVGQVSNCTLANNTEMEINLSFTGNYCEDSRIRVRNSRNTITITGNDFQTSSSGPATDLINVDMNTGGNLAVNIANNNFLGNSTIPNGQFIRLYGNYTGARTITKISNNIVIGGSGKFISYECTGSPAPDLMVNDNDLRSVSSGLGVITGGGNIEVRNNVIH